MIIEIEYFIGDTLLCGTALTRSELAAKLAAAERVYDRTEDNFAELFCRANGFEIITEAATDALPDWVYDRDTGKLYSPKRNGNAV